MPMFSQSFPNPRDLLEAATMVNAPMYAIHAVARIVTPDGDTRTKQMPTFYLHRDVQGITTEAHAEAIATDMLKVGTGDNTTFTVTAFKDF